MKKSIFWMVAAVAMAACSNDELLNSDINSTDEAQKVTVIATLPGGDSRVTLEEENNIIKVDWNESGEAFTAMTTAAVGKDDDQTYVFSQTAGEEFTGTLPTSVEGQPYYAFYPAVDLWVEDDAASEGGYYNYWGNDSETGLPLPITTFSASKVPFAFDIQNGKLNEANTLMYATSTDGTKFTFKHLTAIVKFTLTGLPTAMTDVRFQVSWDDNIFTMGVLDLTKTEVKEMYSTDGFPVINVETTAQNGSCTFYAYLPPLAQGTNLQIECKYENADNMYECTLTKELSKAVEAGKFYRMTSDMTTVSQSRHMTASSVEDLKKWAIACDKWYGKINLTLTEDISLTGNDDLDESNDDSNWPELSLDNGTVVDGDGHTLTGLMRHATGGAAMFAYVDRNATVKNLHLANVDFESSEYIAAGIVAENHGTVEGCSVSGSVTATSNSGYAAGVVASNSGTVKGCYSTATVTASACPVGGVVCSNQGTVTACYNAGTLSDANAGGVVAYNYDPGTVTACYWDCTGANSGIYGGTGSAEKVDGSTVTWETAMTAMNTALGDTGFGWKYVRNTEATTDTEPLKLQKTSATE